MKAIRTFPFFSEKKKCERQLCKRNWSKNNIESAKPKKKLAQGVSLLILMKTSE